MDIAISLLEKWGLWGLLIGVMILIFLNPDKVSIWASWFYRIFRRFSKSFERKSVSLELQGKINDFRRSLNKKIPNILTHGIEIRWVHDEKITRRAFLEKKQVVVVLRSYDDQDVNFVTAILLYLPKALIPYARRYINEKASRAIDFIYARKIIRERKSEATVDYFLNEVLYPELQKDAYLNDYCTIMEKLDNNGILTSILMNELLILSRELDLMAPPEQIIYETRDFINFLNRFVSRKKGEEKPPLDFIRRHIRLRITPIAETGKLEEFGTKPYIEAIKSGIKKGAYRDYIIASHSENVEAAKAVAKSLKYLPDIKEIRKVTYRRAFVDGKQTIAITFILSIK